MNLNTFCGRWKRLNFYFSFEQCEKDLMHLVNSFMICCLLLVDYLSQTDLVVYIQYTRRTISRPSDTRVTLKANKNISNFELICFSPLDRSNGDWLRFFSSSTDQETLILHHLHSSDERHLISNSSILSFFFYVFYKIFIFVLRTCSLLLR